MATWTVTATGLASVTGAAFATARQAMMILNCVDHY